MLTETTVSKLCEMRLSVMANALKDQLADPQFQNIAFEDRLGLLVDAEWNARKNNHLNKLIRQATFSDPGACLENVEYLPDRGLKQEELLRFGTCDYISEDRNIFITGATGSGKTYMTCAFGMEACKRYYATRYIRLPDLLIDLEMSRNEGTYKKVMTKYASPTLLILDEWLLMKPTEAELKDVFELLHRRRKKSSTIFCSQFRPEGWYEQLGGDASPLADAILDQIVHDSYRINIEGIDPAKDISMREIYGMDKSLCE